MCCSVLHKQVIESLFRRKLISSEVLLIQNFRNYVGYISEDLANVYPYSWGKTAKWKLGKSNAIPLEWNHKQERNILKELKRVNNWLFNMFFESTQLLQANDGDTRSRDEKDKKILCCLEGFGNCNYANFWCSF